MSRHPSAIDTTASLRVRCQALADKLHRDAMLRQNSAADSILEFVLAEEGRRADPRLAASLPLVLYFKDDQDRDEFVALVREAKPGMVMRKVP